MADDTVTKDIGQRQVAKVGEALRPWDIDPAEMAYKMTMGTSGNDRLEGTKDADMIFASRGNDWASGLDGNDELSGGLGLDTLTGGNGQDAFVFNTKASKSNADRITDYNVKDDSFWLDDAVFKKLSGTATETEQVMLKRGFFTIGPKAKDKDDYLVYDSKKGVLYYDADGSGRGKAVEIATISKGLKMTHKDFYVI